MGISGEVALGAAKSYTDETVIGGGALKGKNCTISSITEITGGHRVTFKWTLDDGTVETGTMDVMDGQGGGTSDYADLTNKPSINSVTLSGNKTTSDLGISYNDLSNKPTIPSTANCYQTTDTDSDALDNSDKIPFYNVSVPAKRQITFSNLKSKLKTYFDNIYSTITTIGALSDVNISSASNGQVLKYDSSTSKWVNANESGGGGGGSAIDYSTVEQDTGLKWIDGKTIYQKTIPSTMPNCSSYGTNANSFEAVGENIDKFIKLKCVMYDATNKRYLELLAFQQTAKDAVYGALACGYDNTAPTNANTVRLTSANKDWNGMTCYITIQYTKVTT